MTLDTLEARLRDQLRGTQLTLDGNIADVPEVAQFIATLPDARLDLDHVEIRRPDAGTLLVAGSCADWPVRGTADTKLVAPQLTITVGAGLQGAIAVRGSVTIGQASVALRGAVDAGSMVGLSLADGARPSLSLAEAGNFATDGRLHDALPRGLDSLSVLTLTSLSLSFGFGAAASTTIELDTDMGAELTIGDKSLNGTGVAISNLHAAQPGGFTLQEYHGYLHATLHIGQDFAVRLYFDPGGLAVLKVVPQDGNLLPGLEALAELIGGTSLRDTIKAGLEEIKLGELAILNVEIGVDLPDRAFRYVRVVVRVVVAGADIITSVMLPNFQLDGHLSELTPIHLNGLVGHFFPGTESAFPTVDISELGMLIQPGGGLYVFDAGITSDWTFSIDTVDLSVQEFDFAISKTPDGFGGYIEINLVFGGVTFLATATHPGPDEGWEFVGATGIGQQFNLKPFVAALLHDLGLDAPPAEIPEITLQDISLRANTLTKEFEFYAETDADIPGLIQLGNQQHSLKTIVRIFSDLDPNTQKRRFRGFLRGEVNLGTATFLLEYDFNEDNILKGSWDSVSGGSLNFTDLTGAHAIDHDLAPPAGLDLALTRASLELNITQGRILLSAESASLGEVFFIASNANGSWDFVFGVMLRLDQIPGFPHTGDLAIESVSLLLSTVQDDRFQVPSLPGHPVVQPDKSSIVPATRRSYPALSSRPIKLRKGVSVAGLLRLEGSDNLLIGNLQTVVASPELMIQAVLASPVSQSMIYADLVGGVTMNLGGEKLSLSNVVVQFGLSPLSLLLAGSLLVPIQQITLDATGALAITESELEALLDVKATQDGKPTELPFPFGLMGVRLSELGVGVGVDFAPPGVNVALEGKFNVVGQPPGIDSFTLVLEMVEEIPDPQLLSTYIETISIGSLMAAVTGSTEVGSILPAELREISASELTIYWAEEPGLVLPDGTISQAGFGFNGLVQIGSFSAHAGLQLSSVTGASGDAELAPIHLPSADNPLISVTGSGKGVSVRQEQINGVWVKAQNHGFAGRDQKYPTRDYLAVPPGGATVAFNSSHSPYIDLSVQAKILNLFSEDIEISVRDDGFSFLLDTRIGSAGSFAMAHFDLACEVSRSAFHGHAEFELDLKGDIGPVVILGENLGSIHLDIVLKAMLDLRVDDKGFSLTVSGTFWFDDLHLTMPTLTISEEFKSLEELPRKLLEQIGREAETIFKDLFAEVKQLFKDAEAEVEQIAKEAEQEVVRIEQAAEEEAKRIVADAERVYKTLVADADAVEQEAVKIEQEAEQIAKAAVAEVETIAHDVAEEVETLEHEAEEVLKKAEDEVKAIEQAAEAEVKHLEAEAEQVLREAEDEVVKIGQAIVQEVEAIGQAAEREAQEILRVAEQMAEELKAEAERIWAEIEEAARKVVHWVEKAADDVWHALKKY